MTQPTASTQTGGTFKGVIFDFNGVLFWDSHLQERAWRELSAEVRGTPFTDEEMRLHVHGRINAYTLSYLLGRTLTPVEEQSLTQRKEGAYRRLCLVDREAFRLSPGAQELLESLRRRGIPRTIATSSPRVNLDFFIEHLSLGRWFNSADILYDDGTFPGKPAPDIYLKAAARLGLAPADCVVVEDAVSGIVAACRAGIGCIVALGPVERHAELLALEGVTAAIARLDELPALLVRDTASWGGLS
ncbi:HAD family phosphatase [Archangium violaceum]|uniref:HAD family hydrolase n=1 Tax=Archangium violaceum TaxID=83451 RepID=UPI00193C0C40|nr:HAD family phosphatase [Archangium violaceum]QRK10077.1 HAD family phosphatase [Archangium violaceum]